MKKYEEKELCLIWLDSFIGLEYKHKKEIFSLLEDKSSIKEFLLKSKDYLVGSIGEKEFELLFNAANPEYLKSVLDELNKKDVTAITYFSEGYPENLKSTSLPPLVLYAKGNLSLLKNEIFSIVGSRRSLPISVKVAENFSKELIDVGFTLCTGIAEGVDVAVVKSALDNGGKVISVSAGGFDHVYPSMNQEAFEKVSEKGLILSEYPPSFVPKPFNFPIRNRIIAGLGKGVLIVSGGLKSGTMYTAGYAGEYGRDLFAVPYGIGVKSGEGCNELIKRGAILVDKIEDILSYYKIDKKEEKKEFSPEEKEIIVALSDGEIHIDKLCEKLKKQIYEIMPIISLLEIKGVIIKTGFNKYGLIKTDTED